MSCRNPGETSDVLHFAVLEGIIASSDSDFRWLEAAGRASTRIFERGASKRAHKWNRSTEKAASRSQAAQFDSLQTGTKLEAIFHCRRSSPY